MIIKCNIVPMDTIQFSHDMKPLKEGFYDPNNHTYYLIQYGMVDESRKERSQ